MLFDLILEDGTYYTHVVCDARPAVHRGKPVAHALALRGMLRLPFIGLILRNFWAKRKGAFLDPDWQKRQS